MLITNPWFEWNSRSLKQRSVHAQAGPSKNMNWYDANGNGSTAPAGKRGIDNDAMNGNAVMIDGARGEILTIGGAPSYVSSNATANVNLVRFQS